MKISGRVVDPNLRDIYGATIHVSSGIITRIERCDNVQDVWILPGLIDAHLHIESSMVTPGAFAAEAVKHGTVAVIADPHEIANVMGEVGIRFMIEDSKKVPLKFVFGAPSCVPATNSESAGAVLDAADIERLMKLGDIGFLGEVMNFPAVVNGEGDIMQKIAVAKAAGKPVDGHAPGLTGKDLITYIGAGITTDHECTSLEEAREKIKSGMKILIREGSAARNLDALHGLVEEYPDKVMLCCDDIHPDDLVNGHIDSIVRRLIAYGYDIFDIIQVAGINAAFHYNTGTGMLRPGDRADFIIVDSLDSFRVKSTFINGAEVFSEGETRFNYCGAEVINNFVCSRITSTDISLNLHGERIRIIEAFDGELYTGSIESLADMPVDGRFDTDRDILKIVVKERYNDKPPATGFVKGFGIKTGAFASSVAHDSHNIIAVGTSDEDITGAINRIIELRGGLSWVCGGDELFLHLSTGGILSDRPVAEVGEKYRMLTERVKAAGSPLRAPFMTLSFMALLVIPELKIGDRGLFDVKKFSIVPLIAE